MGRYAQLVMGPAGAGKTTYCNALQRHCDNIGRTVHIFNLDPACEELSYSPSVDIRDLISVDDVMEELGYGPNGALLYCMSYLTQQREWLEEELGTYDEDYLIVDLPGQIELYSHSLVMKQLVNMFVSIGYSAAAVYMIDCHFLTDGNKFIAGTLQALSAMLHVELPHINIITKMDLMHRSKSTEDEDYRRNLQMYLDGDMLSVCDEINRTSPSKCHKLTLSVSRLLEDFNSVNYVPLNINDEESIDMVLAAVDHAIQYGEDLEPSEPKDLEGFL